MNFDDKKYIFSKFYEKVGVISWLLFHLIWKKLAQKYLTGPWVSGPELCEVFVAR